MTLQHSFLCFVLRFHILTVLSPPQETIYLLSLLIATLFPNQDHLYNSAFLCFVFEVPYSHSIITPQNNIFVITGDCYTIRPEESPCNSASCVLSLRFHILTVKSHPPERYICYHW